MEQDAEVKRFWARAGAEHGVDLESWEFGLRQAVLLAGARLLERLLSGLGSGRREDAVMCGDLQVKERQCGRAKWSHPGANNSAHT